MGRSEKASKEVEDSQQCMSPAMAVVVAQKQEGTSTGSSLPELTATPYSAENSILFEGELEIYVVPPFNAVQLIRLTRKLDDVSHLKILKTDGDLSERYVIKVFIKEPLSFISVLKGAVEIDKIRWTDSQKKQDGDSPQFLSPIPSVKRNKLVIQLRQDSVSSTRQRYSIMKVMMTPLTLLNLTVWVLEFPFVYAKLYHHTLNVIGRDPVYFC